MAFPKQSFRMALNILQLIINLQNLGFSHVTSDRKYSQSNGGAERMVQTMKNLLLKYFFPHGLAAQRD